MKTITMMAAVLAAACSYAMPTSAEIEKAGLEVQGRLQKQLIKWLDGQMSDAEMAMLLQNMAGKETEEARRYVCLQGALAAYARAGNADAAVDALKRLREETKDFTPEIEKSVVEKAVAKAPAAVAAKIRSALAAPAGEYRDDYFGKLDAKSAEVLRRMKSARLSEMTIETDYKPGKAVLWILEQVARQDKGEPIAYTLHDVPGKLQNPIYVSDISCYDALSFLFGASGCPRAEVFIKDGRVDIYFKRTETVCQYDVVHDEAAERIFGEIEEDGLPKCLNFYSDGNGEPPTRHCLFWSGKFSYERNGAHGTLTMASSINYIEYALGRFAAEGLKCTLVSRGTLACEKDVEGWKDIRRKSDKEDKEDKERLERMIRANQTWKKASRPSRTTKQGKKVQNSAEKEGDDEKTGE